MLPQIMIGIIIFIYLFIVFEVVQACLVNQQNELCFLTSVIVIPHQEYIKWTQIKLYSHHSHLQRFMINTNLLPPWFFTCHAQCVNYTLPLSAIKLKSSFYEWFWNKCVSVCLVQRKLSFVTARTLVFRTNIICVG